MFAERMVASKFSRRTNTGSQNHIRGNTSPAAGWRLGAQPAASSANHGGRFATDPTTRTFTFIGLLLRSPTTIRFWLDSPRTCLSRRSVSSIETGTHIHFHLLLDLHRRTSHELHRPCNWHCKMARYSAFTFANSNTLFQKWAPVMLSRFNVRKDRYV